MIPSREDIIDKLIDGHTCTYAEEFVDWLLSSKTCKGCKYDEYEQSHYCESCIRSAYVSDNYERV